MRCLDLDWVLLFCLSSEPISGCVFFVVRSEEGTRPPITILLNYPGPCRERKSCSLERNLMDTKNGAINWAGCESFKGRYFCSDYLKEITWKSGR